MSPMPAPLWRIWLFGGGADARNHQAMAACAAQTLILDLEDFTPPPLRPSVRAQLPAIAQLWRQHGKAVCIRINALDAEGPEDLDAALRAQPDVIAYPMAAHPSDMQRLSDALTQGEMQLGLPVGSTQILPVCETALGVVRVRELAQASERIRYALLGTEDLAADLMAERSVEGLELAHARRHFLLECRAAGIEPIDAPYTWSAPEGVHAETQQARQLGYRCKSLVRPEHTQAAWAALAPSATELAALRERVAAFEAARARGEDRVLVEGLWIEVPTYKAALRRLQEWGG